MQKWEYQWLSAPASDLSGKLAATTIFNDGKTLFEYIDYMGQDGWELVSVVSGPGSNSNGYYYWFKRPIE